MKKKVIIILSVLILLILLVAISIYLGYEKYLDDNYSANATVIEIFAGTILEFKIEEDNPFLDKGIYCINLCVLKSVKDSNGESFDRFTLKNGDKIKITASPKKLHISPEDEWNIMDGITKLKLLN